MILLTVRDAEGRIVRKLTGPSGSGFHRVAWDLRYPGGDAQSEKGRTFVGARVAPGRFTVSLAKRVDGVVTELAGPVDIEVERMTEGTLPGASPAEVSAFDRAAERVNGDYTAADQALTAVTARVDLLGEVISRSPAGHDLESEIDAVRQQLYDLEVELRGDQNRGDLSAPTPPNESEHSRTQDSESPDGSAVGAVIA